jgi:hypothetical protein
MDTRRLLLGEWHPLLRDPIDLLRLTLPLGAIAYALAGDGRAAGHLAFATGVALLARLASLPRVYDLAVVLAALLQGWGEAFALYDSVAWFDRVVHVLVPLLGAPVVYVLLARLDVVPDPRDETNARHHWGIFVITAALGVAIGAVWETYEYASDAVLGSNLSEGNADTVGDLAADSVGALAGAALLVAWTMKGWGSVRRIPGENRYEQTDVDVSSGPRPRRAGGPAGRAGSRRSGRTERP